MLKNFLYEVWVCVVGFSTLQLCQAQIPASVTPAKTDSMESKTTRLAPMESIACSKRTNSPSRLNSPFSWYKTSVRSGGRGTRWNHRRQLLGRTKKYSMLKTP